MVAEQKINVVPQKTGDLNGALVDFLWQLKRENYAEDTITAYNYSLQTLLDLGVNLFDPQSFIDVMSRLSKTGIRKYNLCKAYKCFLNHHDIVVKLPKYKVTRPLPYIPKEEFLDQLIACCNPMMATFLQILKETAARPGEAWRIEWDDLDIEGRKLYISKPEKGCNPRIRLISEKLLRMLSMLPHNSDHKRIFSYKNKRVAGKTFREMRKRAVHKLGNPELRKIDFYTFRYWKATMEYRRTRDFGSVMLLLGHKSLRYVLLYAQLSEAYNTDKEYICKEATNKVEAMQLIEAGFEYVFDRDGVSLFRKLK